MDVISELAAEYNLEKLCRLCLKEEDNVSSIFASENGQDSFNEIIMACAHIQVLPDDGLPNQVCEACKVQAQSAYDFRKRTEANDVSLRAYMINKFPEKFKPSTLLELKINEEQDFQNVDFSLGIDQDVSLDEEVVEYLDPDDDIKPELRKLTEKKVKNPFECHLCGEGSVDLKELKEHIMTSHELHKLIQCKTCQTQFKITSLRKRQTTADIENIKEEDNDQLFDDEGEEDTSVDKDADFTPEKESKTKGRISKKKKKRGRPSLRDLEVRDQLSTAKTPEEKLSKAYETIYEYSKEEKVALCRICDMSFSKIFQLRNHLNKHKSLDSFDDVDLTTKSDLFDNKKILPEMETNQTLINHIINEICKGNYTRFYQITNINGHEFDLSDSDTAQSGEEVKPGVERQHKCSACQKVFDRLYKILAHMKLDHIESDFTAKCLQCSKVFPNQALLAKHSRVQCLNKEKMYFCRICKIKFMFETSHEKHHQSVHANKQMASKVKKDKAKEKPREKTFVCNTCNKAFYRQEHLDRHLRIHMPSEKKFECTVCQKKFNRKDNLRSHMRVHKEVKEDTDKHLCVYCGRSFSNSSNLIVHMRRHTGEKPYRCDLCDKGFPRSSDLQCHRRTHTGEKPCLCTICGKGFSRSNKLVRHMRIHTGVRPYKCTYCDRAFTQSNDLTLHIRRHTGDKPYVCGICGDRFIQGTALAAHRRMQGHYEEVNQPTPFSSISVNNPNRFTNANRVNRIGMIPNTQPQTTTLIITPTTSQAAVTNIKSEKLQDNTIVIPISSLNQETQTRSISPTIARIQVNTAGYSNNGQLFSSFEVTSLLSGSQYPLQQQQGTPTQSLNQGGGFN